MEWDGTCGTLLPQPKMAEDPAFAVAAARIGVHFYTHHGQDYSDDYILDKARSGVLRGIPVSLVNGRYDLLCPPMWSHETAMALREGGVDCSVDFVDGSGHAGSEPGIQKQMREVMRKHRTRKYT